jgi:hypothetical protein
MCFAPETITAVRAVMDRRYHAVTSAESDSAIRDYRALVIASKGPSSAALRAFASSGVDRDIYNFCLRGVLRFGVPLHEARRKYLLTVATAGINLRDMSKTVAAMTADEMAAAKSSITPEGYRKVGRGLYRWIANADMWQRVTPDYLRFVAAQKAAAAMVEAARTMPWHQFVCHYVAAETTREPADGYTVRGAGDAWELCYCGAPQFPPMSASSLYSWFERTMPLQRLSREADAFRCDVRTRKAA